MVHLNIFAVGLFLFLRGSAKGAQLFGAKRKEVRRQKGVQATRNYNLFLTKGGIEMNKYSLALAIFLLAIWGLVPASSPTAYAEATGGKIVTPRDGGIVTEGEMVLVRVVTFPGQLEGWQNIRCEILMIKGGELPAGTFLPLIEEQSHGNLTVFEWGVKSPGVYVLRAHLDITKGPIIFGDNQVAAVNAVP